MSFDRTNAVVNSALWAAYGDALGFITELTDAAGVQRRAQTSFVRETVTWKRIVGGQFGGQVQLPAGCYSDDTQLRLSTCRTIRPDGSFDVESFAKIELPVFDAYALGAGLSTKAAAHSLTNQSVTWFSNFYRQGKSNYLDAGGNGGVMRIQPHVWCNSSRRLSIATLRSIIRNVFCTHGHPRALAGAIFHALHLCFALSERQISRPENWIRALQEMESIPEIVANDHEIGMIWLPTWEQATKKRWSEAWRETLHELSFLVEIAADEAMGGGPLENRYAALIGKLEADKDKFRGEAMRTALLSQFLAWNLRNDSPNDAVVIAANFLKSDTDTIASVAGALLGAMRSSPPEGEIMDREYIISEANRMSRIAESKKVTFFDYPNVLTWLPPKSQLDVVFTDEAGNLQVAGLGAATELSKLFPGKKRDEAWQILALEFGQTVVIKRRLNLQVRASALQEAAVESLSKKFVDPRAPSPILYELPLVSEVVKSMDSQASDAESLDTLTSRIISNHFPAEEIGSVLLKFAGEENGLEKAIAFAAIVAKAKGARLKKEKSTSAD